MAGRRGIVDEAARALHRRRPVRRRRDRVGLRRLGVGLPVRRGRPVGARARAGPALPAGLVPAEPQGHASRASGTPSGTSTACSTSGTSRTSKRWCRAASVVARSSTPTCCSARTSTGSPRTSLAGSGQEQWAVTRADLDPFYACAERMLRAQTPALRGQRLPAPQDGGASRRRRPAREGTGASSPSPSGSTTTTGLRCPASSSSRSPTATSSACPGAPAGSAASATSAATTAPRTPSTTPTCRRP